MKTNIIRLTGVVFFLLALVGCGASDASAEPVSLKLNWRHGVQFIGFYMAQQHGFYADEGLVVMATPLDDSGEVSELADRVAMGEFDFSLGAGLLMNAQARGVEVTAIGTILHLSPYAFFARSDAGINTPADLVGHTVAVKSDVTRINLEKLLATQNLTLDDVQPVEAGFDMTPFFTGEVDVWTGYLTDEVIRARQQGLDLVTFPLYEYGIEGTAVNLFTNQQLLEERPDMVERFLRASIQGWVWAAENPVEAVDLMLVMHPDLPDDREFYLASFDAYVPLIRTADEQIGEIDCQRWLADERLAGLEDTEALCTEAIFAAATE